MSSLGIDDSGPLDTRNKTTVLILKTNAGSYAMERAMGEKDDEVQSGGGNYSFFCQSTKK